MCFTGALKIYLAIEPQDMRKSFNGLYAAAENELGEDPRKGALFVFCNKRRNRIKTL
jgi:transposase